MKDKVHKKLNISVLYVEDEKSIRDAVSETLMRRVKTLIVAENGKQGLDEFAKYNPDIVITDIVMPLMDGLEMASEIKKIDNNKPVIVTTAHEEREYFIKSIEIGIQSYVIKPIDMKKLKDALDFFAKKIELEKQVNEQIECINSLINLQDNIIIMIESHYLNVVNKPFLDFFGFKDIDEFNGKYESISEFLIEKKEYVCKPKGNNNWLDYLLNFGSAEEIKGINQNTNDKNSEFIVKFKKLPNSDKHIVIIKKKRDKK